MPIDTQSVVNAAWGETITYTRAATGVGIEFTGTRHILTETEGATSYGVYSIRRELYTISTDCLGDGVEPSLRDTVRPFAITPALTVTPARVVTSVSGSPWLKFWKVEAQYPSLATALDQTATVYRPAPTATAEGFRTPNLATVYSSQLVRLQPDSRAREFDVMGKVTTRAKYVCVFGSAVTLNAGDVVEVSSVKYEVVEQSEIESLGLLTFAAVERLS
jgi:hypothetical protein